MELLVGAGWTPLEAIEASTLGAAIAIGRDREVGSLESGKLADLLVVRGDPTRDISHARQIDTVLLGGRLAARDGQLTGDRRPTPWPLEEIAERPTLRAAPPRRRESETAGHGYTRHGTRGPGRTTRSGKLASEQRAHRKSRVAQPSVRRAPGLDRTTRASRADGETGMHTHRQGGCRIRVAVMLVLGALLAGGLREPAEAKDQWVVAVPEEAESLDPQASALFTSEVYQQHIFESARRDRG